MNRITLCSAGGAEVWRRERGSGDEMTELFDEYRKRVQPEKRTALRSPDGLAVPVFAAYDYTPYGLVYGHAGDLDATTHLYTGHEWDAQAGLYYAPYRYYNPFTARWMKRDPLGMVDGPNVYGYVTGSPIGQADRLGLWGGGVHGPCYGQLDDGFWTSPWNPVTGTWRHFKPRDRAERRLLDALERGDWEDFKRYMHEMQDSYSHYDNGFRYPLGHLYGGHWPDDINDPRNAEHYPDMLDRTRWWEQRWRLGNGPLPEVPGLNGDDCVPNPLFGTDPPVMASVTGDEVGFQRPVSV